ncbi:MAG TPA: hypothetical protein VIT45_06900 [Allosphingosinicella sp.]
MFGIPPEDVLKLTVLAALVSVLGNLVALYLKDVLAARSLEKWKDRRALLHAYRRFQLPIFLAADELSSRCFSISRSDRSPDELDMVLDLAGADKIGRPENAAIDPHYLRYRQASNVYRLCAFLGWVELYRRSVGTLDPAILDRSGRIEARLSDIRGVLADGWLNNLEDWEEWRDALIFREEQRAIGHRMVMSVDPPNVIDFGTFFEMLHADPKGVEDARWFMNAAAFFNRLRAEQDFRLLRLKMLVVHLTALMELLQPGRVKKEYHATADAFAEELGMPEGGGAAVISSPSPPLTT